MVVGICVDAPSVGGYSRGVRRLVGYTRVALLATLAAPGPALGQRGAPVSGKVLLDKGDEATAQTWAAVAAVTAVS